jgi:hypothetical protein
MHCKRRRCNERTTTWQLCARGSGVLTPLQHSALQRNAARSANNMAAVSEDQSRCSLCNSLCRDAATAQNKQRSCVRGSEVLTPLQHSHLQGALQEAQNKHGQLSGIRVLTSCNTVHCKGALQEHRNNMGSCGIRVRIDSSATQCTAKERCKKRKQHGSCVRGSRC